MNWDKFYQDIIQYEDESLTFDEILDTELDDGGTYREWKNAGFSPNETDYWRSKGCYDPCVARLLSEWEDTLEYHFDWDSDLSDEEMELVGLHPSEQNVPAYLACHSLSMENLQEIYNFRYKEDEAFLDSEGYELCEETAELFAERGLVTTNIPTTNIQTTYDPETETTLYFIPGKGYAIISDNGDGVFPYELIRGSWRPVGDRCPDMEWMLPDA